MHSVSDEALCARWVENPYFQYFCGEQVFRHELAFDRSSLTRWRHRLGEERLAALLQESLRVAHDTGALATKDLERVAVDTTVQPKAVAHPTNPTRVPKASRGRVTSSAARYPSPPPSLRPKEVSLSCAPRRFTAIPSTAIRSSALSSTSRRTPASRSRASTSTGAIAATPTRTGSASLSPAKSNEPPPSSNAR